MKRNMILTASALILAIGIVSAPNQGHAKLERPADNKADCGKHEGWRWVGFGKYGTCRRTYAKWKADRDASKAKQN